MSTNSTLPEIDNSNTQLSEEEESLSSGNGRLAIIVGLILLLAVVGYMFTPDKSGRRVISSVMPSVMLGEASVTGSRPAEKVEVEATAPEEESPEDITLEKEAVTKPVVRPTAETGLDSRLVATVAPVVEAETVVEAPAAASAAPAAPTTFTLSGRISDENGRPLAGATVLLRGSRKGTGTDANGNYSMEGVPVGENSLVFGYGGYEDHEVRTRGSQPVNVTLVPVENTKRRRN